MTTVNITTNKNTVTIDEDNSSVITVATQGPQGAQGTVIDIDSAVNKSIVYYDGSSSSLKANNTWTTDTLTNGGNF
tara:strand:- start:68 stop:295 length:228 start_codon:yes stop_codon:yes gene_type:complete